MSGDGYLPQSKPATGNNEFNALSFLIKQLLGQLNVATLVQVKAVHTTGRVAPVGYVDVQPLVQQVDGSGRPVQHGIINNVPFLRIQGGACAVIVDPHIGDIGFCIIADRDISSVKAAKAAKSPGSRRRFNFADALYVGGWNALTSPTSYVLVDDSSIEIVSPVAVNITSPATKITGPLHITGPVTGDQTAAFTGDVSGQGTSLHTHIHSGVTPGTGNTGVPV